MRPVSFDIGVHRRLGGQNNRTCVRHSPTGKDFDVKDATAFTRLLGFGRQDQLAVAWTQHRQAVPGTFDEATREALRLLAAHPELLVVDENSTEIMPCERCRELGPFRPRAVRQGRPDTGLLVIPISPDRRFSRLTSAISGGALLGAPTAASHSWASLDRQLVGPCLARHSVGRYRCQLQFAVRHVPAGTHKDRRSPGPRIRHRAPSSCASRHVPRAAVAVRSSWRNCSSE